MSDLEFDYVDMQVGRGHATSLPLALTPTHLQTSIKATDQDSGLITRQPKGKEPKNQLHKWLWRGGVRTGLKQWAKTQRELEYEVSGR